MRDDPRRPTCKNIPVGDASKSHAIDFDDAGFGWHQYELAVALFGLDDRSSFQAIQGALISGYRTVRPLDDDALSLLPLFLSIRRLVQISWMWDRPELGRREGLEWYIEQTCQRVDAFSFSAGRAWRSTIPAGESIIELAPLGSRETNPNCNCCPRQTFHGWTG